MQIANDKVYVVFNRDFFTELMILVLLAISKIN